MYAYIDKYISGINDRQVSRQIDIIYRFCFIFYKMYRFYIILLNVVIQLFQ